MAKVTITHPTTLEEVVADEVILRAEPVDLLNTVGRKIATAFRKNREYDVSILTRRQRAALAFDESGSVKVQFYDG